MAVARGGRPALSGCVSHAGLHVTVSPSAPSDATWAAAVLAPSLGTALEPGLPRPSPGGPTRPVRVALDGEEEGLEGLGWPARPISGRSRGGSAGPAAVLPRGGARWRR